MLPQRAARKAWVVLRVAHEQLWRGALLMQCQYSQLTLVRVVMQTEGTSCGAARGRQHSRQHVGCSPQVGPVQVGLSSGPARCS